MTKLFLIVCLYLLYTRCELLSESYLCIIVHNPRGQKPFTNRVVNCSQNRIFALSFTTRAKRKNRTHTLWIAFRIVSLHYRSQRPRRFQRAFRRCELLSESYLCIIVHNTYWDNCALLIVVNCFQNRIFALSFTTTACCGIDCFTLWIAFRIVSLHHRSQLR